MNSLLCVLCSSEDKLSLQVKEQITLIKQVGRASLSLVKQQGGLVLALITSTKCLSSMWIRSLNLLTPIQKVPICGVIPSNRFILAAYGWIKSTYHSVLAQRVCWTGFLLLLVSQSLMGVHLAVRLGMPRCAAIDFDQVPGRSPHSLLSFKFIIIKNPFWNIYILEDANNLIGTP